MDPSAIQHNCDSAGACTDATGHHAPNVSYCVENKAIVTHSRLEQNRHGWRKIVINFTPSWFSVTMGTGIVSILLHNLPYNATWVYWLSVIVFALNVALFCLFTVISVTRYVMFKGLWSCMLQHPVQSLFLGTIPMGLSTIVNMIVFVCVPAWGHGWLIFAWVLWWIDVVLAITTNVYLPFIIMRKHQAQLSTMTATWLLPVIATIVAAASGSIVASELAKVHPEHALLTIIASYILWGCGISLASIILVMYFQRLTLVSLPPREVIVSVFLPIGPLGQGAFAIIKLGAQARIVFPLTHTAPKVALAGDIAYMFGLLLGLIIWGTGLVWLFFALASITRSSFPFNLGWWGFTFPLGVFALATTSLSVELPSLFFKVLGTIFSLSVVLLWIVVATETIKRSLTGALFKAPCLKDWEREQELSHEKKEDG